MHNDGVTITFRSGPSISRAALLPLSELGGFVSKLSPTRLRLETVRSKRDGAITTLFAEFCDNPVAASSPVDLLCQSVTRLEGELDYEASWGDGNGFESDESWAFARATLAPCTLPSGKPISVVFEPTAIAARAFDLATISDVEIYLGVELTRMAPDPALARLLIPAAAEAAGRETLSPLSAMLSEAITLAKSGGWRAQEYIGLSESSSAFRRVIENALSEEFGKRASFLDANLLEIRWLDAPFEDNDATHTQRIGGLRSGGYVETVFARLCAAGRGIVAAGPGHAAWETTRPPPTSAVALPQSSGAFAFISYAHRNRAFVDDLLAVLHQHRMAFWFDDGIDPGSRWDEALETRIRDCSVLVACVSNEYQASKYCRRELKFADLLNKPILPVAPGSWTWGPGLQMMFQEYQILNAQEAGLPSIIESLTPLLRHQVSGAPSQPSKP